MLRRSALCAAAMLFAAVQSFAVKPAIRDIDIDVLLARDGSATIVETWDVTVASGTEWYLVRENLGDIEISDLSVSDETGAKYVNVGEWDVEQTLERKAGKCGIVHKYSGQEICWGVGSYGDHVFTVKYRMTNVVKSLTDYDALHMQFVSDELSSSADHVKLVLHAPVELSSENARIWGFGYKGDVNFVDGNVVAESSAPFGRNSSLILLIRFDKGFFRLSSVQSRPFGDMLSVAMEGSDYEKARKENIENAIINVLTLIGVPVLILLFGRRAKKKREKKILGISKKDVSWCRDAPMQGDIFPSYYILDRLGEIKSTGNFAAAIILKMIYEGQIGIVKQPDGTVELDFSKEINPDTLDAESWTFFRLLRSAAGEDKILQKNEFKKWAKKNISSLLAWTESCKLAGARKLSGQALLQGMTFNQQGQAVTRQAMGFKKFLEDFTMIGERSTPEVGLWQDYLVFASLFGIADKVSDELKEINPDMYSQITRSSSYTTRDAISITHFLSSRITSAESEYKSEQRRASGGYGGHSSFGGGGGFSGGGHGGGSR